MQFLLIRLHTTLPHRTPGGEPSHARQGGIGATDGEARSRLHDAKETLLMIDVNKVRELAEQWLSDKEYFLVDATVDADNRVVVEIDHKDGVWIDDCCDLSRFLDSALDRDVEDFELEVGSAGIGQPFKVVRQFINAIGAKVEFLPHGGKKETGVMQAADEQGFSVSVVEKQKVEGKKRPVKVETLRRYAYDQVAWVRLVIDFK